MAARKAWVIWVAAMDAQLHVALQGRGDLSRIFMLLPPRKAERDVKEVMIRLDRLLTRSLDEQLGELRANLALIAKQEVHGNSTQMATLAGPLAIHAHKGTVYGVIEDAEGDWLDWKPDSYNDVRYEEGRDPVIVGRRDFDRRRTRRVEISHRSLFE